MSFVVVTNCREALTRMEIKESDDIEKCAGSNIVSPAETVDGSGSRLASASEVGSDDGMVLHLQKEGR